MRALSHFTMGRTPATDMSRRGLVAAVAAAAFAPGLVLAQAAPPATLPAEPDGPDGPDGLAADIAARSEANRRMTIEVRINGRGPYRFIVDTGAERSVIADDVARELGVVHGDKVVVDGLARQIPAESTTLAELAFGPFKRKDMPVPILPRGLLGCDGYLGLDAINKTRVTFDFENHLVRIDSGRSSFSVFDPQHNTTRVQVSGKDGRLQAGDCWVDGVRTGAFIDSGAEISVGNLALHAALGRRKRPPSDVGIIVLTGVTGGEAIGRMIPIRNIRMQALNFNNGTLAIADVPNFANWGLDKRPALLIGMDFLRQFGSVTIDYRTREIRFELASSLDDRAVGRSIARGVLPDPAVG